MKMKVAMISAQERRDEAVAAAIGRSPAVLAEPVLGEVVGGELPRKEEIEQDRAGDAAEELRHHVAPGLAHLEPAGRDEPDRHRRVDVAARDRPDGVDHRHDGEPEGQRDRQDAEREGRREAADRDRPAAEKDETRRAEKLRDELVHDCCPQKAKRRPKLSK